MRKLAIVTGGSSGIGEAISQELVGRGVQVLLVARNASSSRMAQNPACIPIDLDLTQSFNYKNSLSRYIENGLDILVNCAGIGYETNLMNLKEETFDKFFDINVKAMFFLTKYVSEHMNQGSLICNISSIAGIKGFKGWTTYCASKFAIEGFSKALRHELRNSKIKVMVVRPGSVNTPLYDFLPEDEKQEFMSPESIAKAIVPSFFLPANAVTEEIFINNSIGDI